MTAPVQLDEGLFLLDLMYQDTPGVIAAYLLAGPGDDLALVEVGPGSTIPALVEGIRAAGFEPAAVQKLVLTHIHLDHAGAAGELLQQMPQATVYVHEVGAPHMLDPSKLLASAQRIYGDNMDRLWGAFLPVPADRLVVVRDGDQIAAGGRTLQALDTPGHASHHLAYFDAGGPGHLFTGDVAGVRLQGHNYVRPPTPPPDLDLALWNGSIDRIMALDPLPGVLYLTHYGPFGDAPRHLHELRTRLEIWSGIVHTAMRDGQDRAAVIHTLELAGTPALRLQADEDGVARYELAGNYEMSVDGLIRYWRKADPDLASWGR
ncbi:MAG TPA: MBL fold metallo-hydrolase [Chloroflexia bacterium]|nr:MBL fold metallo-hydrolase [Chloroflexia bacterium]